jgi:hypothetical protein
MIPAITMDALRRVLAQPMLPCRTCLFPEFAGRLAKMAD